MENKLRLTRKTLANLYTVEDVAMFATTMLFSVIPTHKIAVAVVEGNTLRSANTIGGRVMLDLSLDRPSINARTVKTRQTQLVNDTSRDPDYFPGDPNETMSSELCVPLIHRDMVLGTINFEHQQPGRYTEEDAQLAETYAREIAEAVHRVHEPKLSKNNSQVITQAKARSPLEIYRDLLKAVYEGETVLNKILNRTAIQWKPGKDMIHDLVTKGYLARSQASARRHTYRITEEGVKALESYEGILEKIVAQE